MQFVQARDLQVGDRIIIGDQSHRIDDVTVGQSRVAIRSATYHLGPITYPAATEILIEDRVPTIKPEPTPPAPQWHVKYSQHNGMASAILMHGDQLLRYGPCCNTEAEALVGLLQLWGTDIEDRGGLCRVQGCYNPRTYGSLICGQPYH
jgi:hypothetical protein